MKTDDVLLLGESEEQVRLAYGVVLAWCYEMRFEHAPKKTKLMLTGPEGALCARLKTKAVWRWLPGELQRYCKGRPRMGAFVPQEETLVYQPFLKYLGDYFDCMMSPDFAIQQRFSKAEEIYVKIHKAVELVSALRRSHLRQTLDCFLRSTLEYPPGVMGGLSTATEAQVEAIYVKAMRLIFGAGVAVHFPHDVMREFMGEATLWSRRRAARAVFSGALAAISVRGPWAEALRCFRACDTPAYTKASVTWAMDAAVRDLGLGQPTGAETKAEWKAVVHAAFRAAETTRRQDAIGLMSSAFRLRTALKRDLVLGYAPLTQEWLHELVLSQQAGGGSMVLFFVLCWKHRLFPVTRSLFPGGPAACYCDLCRNQLAVPADAAHFFLDCGFVDNIRQGWLSQRRMIMMMNGASFAAGGDPLLEAVGLAPILIAHSHALVVTPKVVSFQLAHCFVSHWGVWFVQESPSFNRLLPAC
ncbi:hypothetical protein M885DRAFT_578280 [Pelagophyceae sp. CCMP2097]|nr:hypothetical protein M885DRAFT_578280 [Pelagophyceae sp. CCMP2097]